MICRIAKIKVVKVCKVIENAIYNTKLYFTQITYSEHMSLHV